MQPIRPAIAAASASLALVLTLAACQKPPAATVEAPPPLPPHLGPPPSGTCIVPTFHLPDGGTTTITMTVGNDGGYCAAALVNGAGQPFDAPLVPRKPLHGEETVVRYNGRTSIEYAAKAGFVGTDDFTVHLINKGQAGYTTLILNITVQPAARTS